MRCSLLHFLAIAMILAMLDIVQAQGPTPKFVDAKGADNYKLLFITKTRTAPLLDGKLDDACWKGAGVISDFGHCSYGAKRCAFPRTEARFLWDDRYLYVAFTCYEDTPVNMARHNAAAADKSRPLYDRDCVELHINGNNDNATRFQVWLNDSIEKQIFWHYDFGWGILVNESYGLTADWEYAATRGTDFWQVEGRIALEDIQIEPHVGYIFGMNPTRFRFRMNGMRDDGAVFSNGEVTQFLTWSTQGGSHDDVARFGKCILVEQSPASVAEGLKLAFPDLDKRSVMVQTSNGFDVLDHGKEFVQGYLERAKADLSAAQVTADKLQQALAIVAPRTVGMAGYANQAKPQFEKLSLLASNINARQQMTLPELNAARADMAKIATALDGLFWNVQRSLLLAEGTPRVTVELKPPADAQGVRDEPENTPDPRTRQAPCVPWAKNHVGGKTSALIIARDTAAWDAYALQQRMDLDADVFHCTGAFPFAIGPETDYYKEGLLLFPQKRAQLEKLLQKKRDVYIFMNFNPTDLPGDIQYLLTQRLIEGASVVMFAGVEWGFPGVAAARKESDITLRETMPCHSMTKLVPAADQWLDHRGMLHDSLARDTVPLSVAPVFKTVIGKGRYVSFSAGGYGYWYTTPLSPHVEQSPDERFQSEYFCGLAARIVLDAVGKLPARRLLNVSCGMSPLTPGTPGVAVAMSVGPAFHGGLRIVTRDQWGKVLDERRESIDLPAGTNSVSLKLSALVAGNYYVDAWLMQGDKVMDWASQRFKVQGRMILKAVNLARETTKPGDAVTADVTVEGATPSTWVRAELRDIHGRVVARQDNVTPKDGHARVELPLDRAWYTYEALDVYAVEGGVTQDRITRTFTFRHPERDDFTAFTDGDDPNRMGALRQSVLRGFGIGLFEFQRWSEDLLGNGGDLALRYWLSGSCAETGGSLASEAYQRNVLQTFRKLAEGGMARNVRFISTGDDSGVQPDFVETVPTWVMPLIKRLAAKYPPASQTEFGKVVSPEFYKARGLPNRGEHWRWLWNTSLKELQGMKLQPGDFELFVAAFREAYPDIQAFNRANGVSLAGFEAITPEDLAKLNPPRSPDAMGFQDWLRAKYGRIETLNSVWGAAEQDFETLPVETIVATLTGQGKYAASLDKQAYLEDLFIRHMRSAADGVHAVDPGMGVGQGAGSFGNIIPEVLEHTDTYVPYLSDVSIEIGRSMPHKWVGQTLGVYGGKAVKLPARQQQVWHTLFSGGNFIWFWSACTGGLMGDLSTNPNRSGTMLETLREIQAGIGACLLRGKRLHDGIAILHSRASGHMSGIVKEMSTQADSEFAFQTLIEDQGLQYRYISTRQLEAGILKSGEFKVLVLPYTQIITPAEAEEIKAFVKNGGAVMADLRAGTFSPEGKPLAIGTLDELFGITRMDERAKGIRGALEVTGLTRAPLHLDGFQADASVKAVTAKASGNLGGVPVLMINDSGKGKAMLLNVGAGAYNFLLGRNALGDGRVAFRKLFELAGVKSRFRVEAGGQEVPGVERAVFKRGQAEYLTVEKRSFGFEKYPLKVEIVLDRACYVTDMRSGKRFGKTDRIPVQLEGLSCHVFSLLPYKVEELEVSAPQSVKRGDDMKLEIVLKTDAPSDPHVIRVEVTTPDGSQPFEVRKLDTQDGKTTCILPVAFNDPVGTWRVIVTDIASGLSKTVNLKVMP